MKIAVWHNLPSGGGKRALFDHVKGLVQRGHTVESWCPPTADFTYLPLKNLITEHIVPLALQFEPAKSTTLSLTHLSMVQKIRAMDQHCQICADAINDGNFDLLFANTGLYFHTTSIGYKVRLPSLLYLQEPARWLYEARPYLPWIALPSRGFARLLPKNIFELVHDIVNLRRIRFQALKEASNARGFNRILVNSYFSRESIIRTYGVDARVCYLGIDTDKFSHYQTVRGNFVIGLGSITAPKNIKLVIESLSKLRGDRPSLVWVGNAADQSYLSYIQQLAEQLEVKFEPRVMVTDKDLVELLNQAKLMVYTPSLEPYGYAPLEASSCGLPVVGIAEGGLRETIQHGVNGLLVDADADEIASAIARILAMPQLAAELGRNGRKLVVEKWSLTAALDRLEKHFGDVLSLSRQSVAAQK